MANSLGEAWICAYLIDVGERYNGSLTKEQYRDKRKKVQLIEVRYITWTLSVLLLLTVSAVLNSS